MILKIDETDVTSALMERPNITLENQANNRFSVVASISQLKLKYSLIPIAILEKIHDRQLITSEIYSDEGNKVFSGFINGNGVVIDYKHDQLHLDTLSLLYLPKEIDFVFQGTYSVRDFLDKIKGYLTSNGLWKAGSIESLYAPANLRWHVSFIRIKGIPLIGESVDRVELGYVSINGGAYLDGIALKNSSGTTQAYLYFTKTNYHFTPAGATIDFDNSWVTTDVPDKGEQIQVLFGSGGNLTGLYYIDYSPSDSLPYDAILYCLAPIYWPAEYAEFSDIEYEFDYKGKLSDALLDFAMLTDSKIYYDENGIGYIVFQNYSAGTVSLNGSYLINFSNRFVEENLSNAINFKGVNVPDAMLNQYVNYYEQRAFYDKRFQTTEIEVYPYPGIDNIKIFSYLISFDGDVLRIEKNLQKKRYKITVR